MTTARTATSATGACFALESQLCEVLAASISEVLRFRRPAAVLEEIQVGMVIPDLVIVDPGAGRWGPVTLTSFESWIVADLLRARSRRVETLSRRLFARPDRTSRAVERLERVGLLNRGMRSSFSLVDNFPRDAEVVAVEAKLRRWREAVDQATDYLRFANRAYVALPQETVASTRGLLPLCRSRRVGVIAVSGSTAEIVRVAPLHEPKSPGWVWLVARALESGGPLGTRRRIEHRAPRGLVPQLCPVVEVAAER
jgi:hypothetical protein